ncbi:MAG: hypothetical protein IPK82_06915 [Polyangiaceae bacterium]|nr:hypothetical protein [Polyangiaceae bacterium]
MWLHPWPVANSERAFLPPGDYLIPWYLSPSEIGRLAELLGGFLIGVERAVILPYTAAWSPTGKTARALNPKTLYVVTCNTSAELESARQSVGQNSPLPILLHSITPQGTGYAWQERYLKGPLLAVFEQSFANETHPLATFGLRDFPIDLAATLTSETLELVDLIERTIFSGLANAQGSFTQEVYTESLYQTAGQMFVERMLRILPHQTQAAWDVLQEVAAGNTVESVTDGYLNDYRRGGVLALESVGLVRYIQSSLSLGPLARWATQPQTINLLETQVHYHLPFKKSHQWVHGSSVSPDQSRDVNARIGAREVLSTGAQAAADIARALRELQFSTAQPTYPLDRTEGVRRWVLAGGGFNDQCERARDFLTDPARKDIIRTTRDSEYRLWLLPLESLIRQGNPPGAEDQPFRTLNPNRFDRREPYRLFDAVLSQSPRPWVEFAQWIEFALNLGLPARERSHYVNLLSWIWRESALDSTHPLPSLSPAHDAIRRCLAEARKNGYQLEEPFVAQDAEAVGIDVSAISTAWERPAVVLSLLGQAFQQMSEGQFQSAKEVYERAALLAQQQSDAFGEWLCWTGVEEALHAQRTSPFEGLDRATESAVQARKLLEQSPQVGKWLERISDLEKDLLTSTIGRYERESHQRLLGGWSIATSDSPREYWTLFRDLETADAPPLLQRRFLQPLLRAGLLSPAEELSYLFKLGVSSSRQESGVFRAVHSTAGDLEQRNDLFAQLRELYLSNDGLPIQRRYRLQLLGDLAPVLYVQDLDWVESLLRSPQTGALANDAHTIATATLHYLHIESRVPKAVQMVEHLAATQHGPYTLRDIARRLNNLPIAPWVALDNSSAEKLALAAFQMIQWADPDATAGAFDALLTIVTSAQDLDCALSKTLQQELLRACLTQLELADANSASERIQFAPMLLAYSLTESDTDRAALVQRTLDWDVQVALPICTELLAAGIQPSIIIPLAEHCLTKLPQPSNLLVPAEVAVDFLSQLLATRILPDQAKIRALLVERVVDSPASIVAAAAVLSPHYFQSNWHLVVDLLFRAIETRSPLDPLAHLKVSPTLLGNVSLHAQREFPEDLTFLFHNAVFALNDKSFIVAHRAAYAIVAYARHAKSPTAVSQVVRSLRQIANAPCVQVRGAAAYAGTRLPFEDCAPEILEAAADLDRKFASDSNVILVRQRMFGRADAQIEQRKRNARTVLK